jgi:hypothetical protein
MTIQIERLRPMKSEWRTASSPFKSFSPSWRRSAPERRSVASRCFTPEHDPDGSQKDPDSPFDPRSLRQANIATSALVIARILISIIPNTACTTQPI